MKLKGKILMATAVVGAGIWIGTLMSSNTSADGLISSNQPGSIDDPVITKSYLDEQLKKISGGTISTGNSSGAGGSGLTESQVKAIIADATSKLKDQLKSELGTGTSGSGGTGATGGNTGTGGAAAENLTVVKLTEGQMVLGGIGTEMVVRTGTALAYSNTINGIPDLTGGKDIASGKVIELNHLLLFPTEGRGVKADPKVKNNEVYVMIKGGYLLVEKP